MYSGKVFLTHCVHTESVNSPNVIFNNSSYER